MAILYTICKSYYRHNFKVSAAIFSSGKIWTDPKYDKWRAKLYKKEGIKVDKNNKIIDFEKIIYTF
jgi:hypothetical protein